MVTRSELVERLELEMLEPVPQYVPPSPSIDFRQISPELMKQMEDWWGYDVGDKNPKSFNQKGESAMSTVMVRSRDAGVFYGELETEEGDRVSLLHARRCWYWDGAASLSELATEGPGRPENCKFPAPTEGSHVILGVCEIIPVTERAFKSLESVPVWSGR